MERFHVIPVHQDLYEDVIQFTYDHFFPRDPLALGNGFGRNKDPEYEEDVRKKLSQGLSLAAIEKSTGKLVGIAINTIVKKTDLPDCSKMAPDRLTIYRLLDKIEEGIDIFEMFQTDEAWELYFLGVHTQFSGLGLARVLFEESLTAARKNGLKIVRTNPTNPITMQMFEKSGFQTLNEMKLMDFVNEDGEACFPFASDKSSVRLCVKLL